MRGRVVRLGGETWISLETLADCYRVEVTWVEEVYGLGLLGRGERAGEGVLVSAGMLDRMGRILRLHHQQGIDLFGILRLLDEALEPEGG